MEPTTTGVMTVGYLVPIYMDDETIKLDWDDDMEMSLLLVIGTVISMQLLFLIYVVISSLQPCSIYRQQRCESCRRRYGNFIFRRLLAQLDRALMLRANADVEELSKSCVEAKHMAETAIRLFWRDATKVLYPDCEVDSQLASDMYFVLDDEEAELNAAGYASVDYNVTHAFLESLMYPKRAEISSKTNSKP